jgi:hypothetical protein
MRGARRRTGLTLVELLAALSLAGFSLLGGIALLDQLGDSASRIAQERAANDIEANAERMLRKLLIDAQPAIDSTQRFRGNPWSASYPALCEMPAGWRETCRITLAVDSTRDSTRILAETDKGGRYVLRRLRGNYHLRFLNPINPDSVWVSDWPASMILPSAVGLVSGPDTIVYPIGAGRE